MPEHNIQNMNDEQLLAYVRHLKERAELPYRQGVVGIVRDNEGNFLVVQMINYPDNGWRFPGGGVDEGEQPKDALLREFGEELNTQSFEIIRESILRTQYDFPVEEIIRGFHKRGVFY